MICLICRKAETADGLTFVIFERGEFRLTVKGVPARLCPSCGEAYLEEATADHLLSLARRCFQDGSLETECEFGAL
jgi:YgiT-type zinc finger domain-containing protein